MRAIAIAALIVGLPATIAAQRPSPEEAVAVLRASHSIADLTDAHFGSGPGPQVFVMNSSPTAGPFGEFKPFGPTEPLSRGPYVFGGRGFGYGCNREFSGERQGDRTPDSRKNRHRALADKP